MSRQSNRSAGATRQGRDPALERLWRERVREQVQSKLSVRDYCDWRDLRESAFYHWRREIARRDVAAGSSSPARQDTPPPPRFLPVVLTAPAVKQSRTSPRAEGPRESSAAPIEVEHPGGIVVRVPVGGDAETLATILDVLERRSC